MATNTQAAQYARQFEAVSETFIATVAGCSDEQLRRTTAAEHWPVVVVAHHLGAVYGFFGQTLAEPAPADQEPMPFTAEFIDENNARHAREFANVGKQETLELLRENRSVLARSIRGLDDVDLERTMVTFDGHGMSVADMIHGAMIAHTEEHLASIRATIAA
jgi:hypothetical protein